MSRPGESHPQALAEPSMNVSAQTAPVVEPRRTPLCPCAKRPGSRRERRVIPCGALRKWPRRFCSCREAQRASERSRGRLIGDRAAREYRPSDWSQPRICGLNIRARSSMDLSRRSCSFPSRISARLALPAWAATAGRKLMTYFSHRCFDRRGRNVSPRKSVIAQLPQ